MTNPVRIHPPFALPPVNTPIVDPYGVITGPWYQFLMGIFQRTGSETGASAQEAMDIANEALTEAQGAVALATSATATANAALAQANAVAVTANAAQSTANFANSLANVLNTTTLKTANNLADVINRVTARANLAVDVVPAVFHFAGLVDTRPVYWPIFKGCTIAANMASTLTRCGTVPSGDVTVTLSVVRGGSLTVIGNIVLVNHSQGSVLPLIAQFRLIQHDVLQIQATMSDATLRDLMIGIPLILA